MMSSILNSDFISIRLIVQGMSLENNGIKSRNKKIHSGAYCTYCVDPAVSQILHVWQVNIGNGVYV